MLRMNWLGTSEPSSQPGIGTANPAGYDGERIRKIFLNSVWPSHPPISSLLPAPSLWRQRPQHRYVSDSATIHAGSNLVYAGTVKCNNCGLKVIECVRFRCGAIVKVWPRTESYRHSRMTTI
jgi:hypothetical protein